MSYKLFRLSPQASTRIIRLKPAPDLPWFPGFTPEELDAPDVLPLHSFWQAWFENESAVPKGGHVRINWGAISGLVLSIAASATFWIAVVWAIEQIWK